MEVGDENLPPSSHSWTGNSVCVSPRSPGTVRSVLTDVNTSVNEVKNNSDTTGSGTVEEEKCEALVDPEAEAWSERTAVITRYDHETHLHLARGFVQDLADKVVADNWKEPEPKKEDFKPPDSLNLKKQKLFLPDLVPNVVLSVPSTDIGTVSESDEYESADEQPEQAHQLHDTLYLDSTVHPAGGLCNASTPIDCPGWQLDFDSSHVLPVGDVTVDASLKDYSLPVIDQAPESLSEEPTALNKEVSSLKETHSLGALRSFPQTVRKTQPFSPSSGSDVDSSVLESESDTLAAVTPNNVASEVDVDLITKFEQLVLCKQLASHNSPSTPALNTTFPLNDETTAIVQLKEAASSVIETEEGDLPADATRDVLSETQDVPSANPNDSEVTSTFEQEECSFALLKAVRQKQNQSALQEKSSTTVEDSEHSVAEITKEENVSYIKEPINSSAGEENILIAEVTPVSKEETVQVSDEQGPAFEEKPVDAEPNSVAEELTVPVVEEQPIVVAEQVSEIVEEKIETVVTDPVVDEAGSLEVIPAEIATCEVDQTRAEDDSTFLSSDEQTVLNAGDKNCTVDANETTTGETEPSAVIEEDSAAETPTLQEVEAPKVKPTSLPEEKPIVPKKGYDLSFLDRFDNLENATPSISQAKQLPSLPIEDSSSSDVIEPQTETGPATPQNDQQVEVNETSVTTEGTVTDKQESLPVVSQEFEKAEEFETPAQEEPAVELKTEESVVETTLGQAQVEEPLILPKKGYDLSFLDKLENLENASPTAITNGSQEPTMKESPSTKDNVTEPSDEQSSPEAKTEKPAGSSPAKKGPVVRKPIRPRVARPAAAAKTDAFEVEFAFDPNEDPFKSKKKLEGSPTRDGSPKSQADPNATINASNDAEANDTVIESIPDTDSLKLDNANARTMNEDEDEDQEEFRPAQEVFHDPSELDFLMQHGGASHDIALARQSLFVKFDPLVTGRPSMFPPRPSDGGADETILADDSSGRKSAGESLFLFSPPHSSSAPKVEKTESVEKQSHQECLMSSKNVTGDVLSLNEHKEALKLQELLFQDKLLQKEREILMKENEIQDFKSKLDATAEAQAQMRQIVGEYEKTISQLIAEKEREKANMETTLQNTIKERDQAIEDLKEVERAFSEFHRMYERNRTAAENLHKNEEALKKALAAYQDRLQQEQHKYETLKLHAAQKLEGAQQEMENLKRNLEGESSRVKAQLKKTEMRLASVEQSLEQKSKENEELTTLCDELINKLGSSAK